MARTLTAAVTNALAADHVAALVFVSMDFSSGVLYVCNAAYDIDWNGHTWLGAGMVGRLDAIEEAADQQARAIALYLSGIPPDRISTALGEYYQGRAITIWFAPLNPAGYAVYADPVVVFTGRMDTMNIELGKTASITLTAESRQADQNRPRVRRYNHGDQVAFYPNDLGLQYVEQMASVTLLWGRGGIAPPPPTAAPSSYEGAVL